MRMSREDALSLKIATAAVAAAVALLLASADGTTDSVRFTTAQPCPSTSSSKPADAVNRQHLPTGSGCAGQEMLSLPWYRAIGR